MNQLPEPENQGVEVPLEMIRKKAAKGLLALTGRTFILQLIALIATILLNAFLNPEEYGVFFLVGAVIGFLGYFSDIGLAAALIQKKEPLTDEELQTTFTVQQLLVGSLVLLAFLATPLIERIYQLSPQGVYLLWAMLFSFILSSLKTIPSVLLERKLEFEKLIIPQIGENLVFYGTAVFLAWLGWGINSYTIAVLLRGVVGLGLMYLIMPWGIGLAFSFSSLNRLFKYGVPYQANTLLAMVKDNLMTLSLGALLGKEGIGLLGWANQWGSVPLRFFMDQVIKISFPAYSRVQDDHQTLSKFVHLSLYFISLLVFPSLILLVMAASVLTEFLPQYQKWQPAIVALGLISVNSAWAAITTPLTNLLNAVGKVGLNFRLMVFWTILTWILLPLLSYQYGVNGAAVGSSLVGSSSLFAIILISRQLKISVWPAISKIVLASGVMLASMSLTRQVIGMSWLGLLELVTVGGLSFTLTIWTIDGQQLWARTKMLISLIMEKS